MSKTFKVFLASFLTLAVIAGAGIIVLKTYDKYKINLSQNDRNEIVNTVDDYYNNLTKEKYRDALALCQFENKENTSLDIDTRIKCLEEVRSNIVKVFKYDSIVKNGSNKDQLIINYDDTVKAYYVTVTYEIAYNNENSHASQENIYLRKLNNKWVIVYLVSADRYVGYRIQNYRYVYSDLRDNTY